MCHRRLQDQQTDYHHLWWDYPTRCQARRLPSPRFQEGRPSKHWGCLRVIRYVIDRPLRFRIESQGRLYTGAYATGKISEEERLDVIRNACPGSGACGGMFTYVDFRDTFILIHLSCLTHSANTMGTALEVLGLALPYSSGIPSVYPGKLAHFPGET